jgi:hypothetical protein
LASGFFSSFFSSFTGLEVGEDVPVGLADWDGDAVATGGAGVGVLAGLPASIQALIMAAKAAKTISRISLLIVFSFTIAQAFFLKAAAIAQGRLPRLQLHSLIQKVPRHSVENNSGPSGSWTLSTTLRRLERLST